MTMIRIFLLLLYAWFCVSDGAPVAWTTTPVPGTTHYTVPMIQRNATRPQVNIQVIQVQLREWSNRPPTSTVVTTPKPKTSVVFRTNSERSRDSYFPKELTVVLSIALISVGAVLLAASAYGAVYVLTRRNRPKFDHSQAIVFQRPLVRYPEDYPTPDSLSAERNRRYPTFEVTMPQRKFEPSNNFRLQREVRLLRGGLNLDGDWAIRKVSY